MKNFIILLLGLVIGALLTYFFCPRNAGNMNNNHISEKAPKDTISVAEATSLFKNWQKNNPTEIDSLIDVEGPRKITTNVAWSLDVVKEYLAYAEAKADTLGFKMTGITVYMGNYGKNLNPKKKNRNTLFIVPTGVKNTSKASSFYNFAQDDGKLPIPPLNNGGGGGEPYP